MFKGITIKLTGPICNCEDENLTWDVYSYANKDSKRLEVMCNNCKTQLAIPHNKFGGFFQLDKPYPGRVDSYNKKVPEAKVLKLIINKDDINFKE